MLADTYPIALVIETGFGIVLGLPVLVLVTDFDVVLDRRFLDLGIEIDLGTGLHTLL